MTIERQTEFMSAFRQLQNEIYSVCDLKGFKDQEENPLYVPTKLALIMSEGAEALEAHRRGTAVGSELADIVIRTMDLAETLKIDLGLEIVAKHEFNKTRPYRHGEKRY